MIRIILFSAMIFWCSFAHSASSCEQLIELALLEGLEDPEIEVRLVAIDALGQTKPVETQLALVGILKMTRDEDRLIFVANKLREYAPPNSEVQRALVAALEDDDARSYATDLLKEFPITDREVLLALKERLKYEEVAIRLSAASILSHHFKP